MKRIATNEKCGRVTYVQSEGGEKRSRASKRSSTRDKNTFMTKVLGISLNFKFKLLKNEYIKLE